MYKSTCVNIANLKRDPMEPVNRKFIKVLFALLFMITLIIECKDYFDDRSHQSVVKNISVQKHIE